MSNNKILCNTTSPIFTYGTEENLFITEYTTDSKELKENLSHLLLLDPPFIFFKIIIH